MWPDGQTFKADLQRNYYIQLVCDKLLEFCRTSSDQSSTDCNNDKSFPVLILVQSRHNMLIINNL